MEIRDLGTFLDYWDSVFGRTTRLLAVLPPEQIEWSHAPGRWTIGDIARHLVNIERDMYAETVAGRPSRYEGHARSYADGYEAVMAYRVARHAESMAIFGALTPERLAGKSMTPAGTPITTWKWLRAMLEHEAHHRGQLYLMMGMLGIVTPPIYGLTEEEVAARANRGAAG
jgi:uncharacterized damage-inducible protein DinB